MGVRNSQYFIFVSYSDNCPISKLPSIIENTEISKTLTQVSASGENCDPASGSPPISAESGVASRGLSWLLTIQHEGSPTPSMLLGKAWVLVSSIQYVPSNASQ